MAEKIEIGKYLEVEELLVPHSQKTKQWAICSRAAGSQLGILQWYCSQLGIVQRYSGWRQYTFDPFGNTIFNERWLCDIADFLKEQTAKQKG